MIGYYVHHQGAGHSRRALAVARRLRHEVTGLGSGGRPTGWPGPWVSLPRDDVPLPDREQADVTAGGRLHWAPRHHDGLLRRHASLVRWLEAERPALVVVDVSVEVSLLVRLCGVPVVVGGMPGERTDAVHALAYDVADAILAPWPPGAHPEAGWPRRWMDKTWEVGGISALADDPAGPPPSRSGDSVQPGRQPDDGHAADLRDVLLLWGSGGDDLDPEQLEAARRASPGWRWTVRGGGHDPSPDLLADLSAADLVVCHAGQGAVADVALVGRPAVVLAQPRPHGEQEATAAALDRLGLAATATGWPAAEEWPGLLDRAVSLCGAGWSRWGGLGAQEAAERLDRLAEEVGR